MTPSSFAITSDTARTAPLLDDAGGEPVRPRKLLLLTVGLGVGGTEGQLLEIASRLSRDRFAVTVCALKGEDVIARELRERGIRVITLGGKGAWDLRVLARLVRLLRRERPDFIHAFLSLANLAACAASTVIRGPVLILSFRDVETWKRWPRVLVDRLTVRWAEAVTCSSQAIRRFAITAFGGDERKYHTIHNGIDVGRFAAFPPVPREELGLRRDASVIGTVCRLEEPKKGLSVLLRAMAELTGPSFNRNCQLLIVGEGPALPRLKALSAELGLAAHVVFAGMRRDIARVLPVLDVFVLPSLYEGFGIAIVEAMAAGRPVVATDVGGIPEIVVPGETGLLVSPGDPDALAAAIDDLLRQPEKARALAVRGQRRAREWFSIETVVQRHEALYDELWVSRGRRGQVIGPVPDVRRNPHDEGMKP